MLQRSLVVSLHNQDLFVMVLKKLYNINICIAFMVEKALFPPFNNK